MPIVPIKIKSGEFRNSFKTALCYGRPRSGKTRFLASWPRPLILAEASERGWVTIETMPSEGYFEPDRPPLVWPIEDAQQMQEALGDARGYFERGEALTLGIDSLTFYQDALFAANKKRWIAGNPGKPVDGRALYGQLGEQLGDLRQDTHTWPCNVVWLALEKAPDTDAPIGGPLLTGKTRDRFPAGCDHIFRHESYTVPNATGGEDCFFEMHTTVHGRWLAGGRDSGMLEPSIFNPTYRDLMEQLNLPDPIAAFENARKQAATVVTRRVVSTNTSTPATNGR